jgi:uncharacterized protein involved in exopolysaccharide biosynthesis
MTTQLERPPELDLDAEREVDLRSAWQRIVTRWWLPVGGLLIGALVGILLAFGGGSVWRAETLVYLGQPFTPAGGGAIPNSIATNPRIVGEVVRSEAALKAASRASRIPVSQLRGNISTAAIVATGQARGTTTLYEIAVQGKAPRKVERAADSLATRVSGTAGDYVEEKVTTLKDQIAADEQELAAIDKRFDIATRNQNEVLQNESLPLTERLLFVTSLNSTLTALEQRRGTLQEDLLTARQLLSLATKVEQSRVVEPAVAAKTTARSARTSAVVGALIGLLLGAVAALAAEPILARRNRAAAR